MRIGYLTDEPGPAFAKAIRGARTKDALLAALSDYKRVASDAVAIVKGMTPATFKEFRAGLAKEQLGKYAGDAWAEKYGPVVMPDVMMAVSMTAQHFKAPWGTAFIRMEEMGYIAETNGGAHLTDKWRGQIASAASPTSAREEAPGGATKETEG